MMILNASTPEEMRDEIVRHLEAEVVRVDWLYDKAMGLRREYLRGRKNELADLAQLFRDATIQPRKPE